MELVSGMDTDAHSLEAEDISAQRDSGIDKDPPHVVPHP
jgi:hypothetical protein